MRHFSALHKSDVSRQSFRLRTPITAEVLRWGSSSLHGSEYRDDVVVVVVMGVVVGRDWEACCCRSRSSLLPSQIIMEWVVLWLPIRSMAMRLHSGLPSNTRILWHPDVQSWLFNGVASYRQSPGRVSWECGTTNVIGESVDSSGLAQRE